MNKVSSFKRKAGHSWSTKVSVQKMNGCQRQVGTMSTSASNVGSNRFLTVTLNVQRITIVQETWVVKHITKHARSDSALHYRHTRCQPGKTSYMNRGMDALVLTKHHHRISLMTLCLVRPYSFFSAKVLSKSVHATNHCFVYPPPYHPFHDPIAVIK